MMPPGPGWVLGEFVGYNDPTNMTFALEDLDQLEDVPGGLFTRVILPVVLPSGQCYQAWAYVFPEDRLPRLSREAVELTSGDWSPYLC